MDTLNPDWREDRPTDSQMAALWGSISVEPVNRWTNAAEALRLQVNETHSNGGMLLHRFKIIPDAHFAWFASRNRLHEIEFLKNLLSRLELQDYRDNLKIEVGKPAFSVRSWRIEMYELPGNLARVLGEGGAYHKLDSATAWKLATDFVQAEVQNRFDEVLMFDIVNESAKWFRRIAWDYSVVLYDKRRSEVVFIDITDTD